jgi:hypothetical protein
MVKHVKMVKPRSEKRRKEKGYGYKKPPPGMTYDIEGNLVYKDGGKPQQKPGRKERRAPLPTVFGVDHHLTDPAKRARLARLGFRSVEALLSSWREKGAVYYKTGENLDQKPTTGKLQLREIFWIMPRPYEIENENPPPAVVVFRNILINGGKRQVFAPKIISVYLGDIARWSIKKGKTEFLSGPYKFPKEKGFIFTNKAMEILPGEIQTRLSPKAKVKKKRRRLGVPAEGDTGEKAERNLVQGSLDSYDVRLSRLSLAKIALTSLPRKVRNLLRNRANYLKAQLQRLK